MTKIRNESDIRSHTVTPEPVQETLTQEIVWVPETRVRRGSYTIDKSDGNGFIEHFKNSEVVPVENGVIRTDASGERGSSCTEERSNKVIQREGMEQKIEKSVQNASAHERTQAASEDVRTSSETHDIPGGHCTTTTTTTVKKVGTAARKATATSTASRTSTTLTSRDVGTK